MQAATRACLPPPHLTPRMRCRGAREQLAVLACCRSGEWGRIQYNATSKQACYIVHGWLHLTYICGSARAAAGHGDERLSDTVSNGPIPLLLVYDEASKKLLVVHMIPSSLFVWPPLLPAPQSVARAFPYLPPLLHEPLDGGGRASNGSRYGGSRIVRHSDGRAPEMLDRCMQRGCSSALMTGSVECRGIATNTYLTHSARLA